MENYNGEKVCRLCLNSTCSPIELTSHEAGLQMCGLCLPEIDLSICYDSALCSKCFHYLENVYIFKIRCLQTEEKLRLYLENCDPQKINLQHIMECVTNVEDELDSEICRSCLTTSSEFTSVGEDDPILRNMFATCIPEMDLSLLGNPVICNSCVNRVKDFYTFKSKCLQTEGEIINFKDINRTQKIDLPELLKLEDHKETMIEHINLDSKVKIEPDYVLKSEYQKKTQISEKEVKTEILLDSKTNLKDETFGYVDIENLKPEILLTEEDFHVENYGWDETKDEISQDADDIDEIGDSHLPVRLQMLTQNAENPLGETVKWYNCENCSYHTKWKHHLERHKQVHEARVSHQKSFKCLTCGFITKYKHALLKHSTLEHGEWFKCEECKYETKWKRCYNQHLLNHKGGQIWYHCEICSYKSKWKYHLKRHMVTHE